MILKKDKLAARICKKWALNYYTLGMYDEARFWVNIELAFEGGPAINANELRLLKTELRKKQQETTPPSHTVAALKPAIQLVLNEIVNEAVYLESALKKIPTTEKPKALVSGVTGH